MQGKTINGYTLQYRLGKGGMAEVWYAENAIGKKAAVKLLFPQFCDDENTVARFENEAKVMVKLEHPYIRQVYDYTKMQDRPCIIMEYLEGNDLKSLMEKGTVFNAVDLVKWWNQMTQALNYTHAMGVVHRDIKPANVFVDKHGNIKLLDFGIAKNEGNNAYTKTGKGLGTRIYMSPEQVKDPKRVDYRSDYYSLAVTFVHLLTGKKPYDMDTSSEFEVMMKIVNTPLDMSGVPVSWQAFLKPYLEKEPDKRPRLSTFGNVAAEPQPKKEETTIGGFEETIMDAGHAQGHDYVDLGLPSGTLWATCNIGASKPEGYGNYYAWGETDIKKNYNWDTYKYAKGNYDKLTKYCNQSQYGDKPSKNGIWSKLFGEGFTDNLTELQIVDDPATSNWGGGWRTPSKAQWDELLANTTHQCTTKNGVVGRKFTSKRNGQTLFLPAAGGRWDSELYYAGSYGDYWSRSLDTGSPDLAWGLNFISDDCYMYYGNRYYGFSVRPVRKN
ncbi:MAG: protein kinase [Bacteroidales bacterium]|nr:protein kinase [Bacteroidales bacterium]